MAIEEKRSCFGKIQNQISHKFIIRLPFKQLYIVFRLTVDAAHARAWFRTELLIHALIGRRRYSRTRFHTFKQMLYAVNNQQ